MLPYNPRTMSEALPTLLDRLRDRGWRLTAQRRAVVEVLQGDDVHLTADEVHRAVEALSPEVSRATIYNTLNELVAMGEVGVVRLDGCTRFDPNVVSPHHHLVCDRCGAIRDVAATGITVGDLVETDEEVFVASRVDLVVHGECADRGACDLRRGTQTPSA